MARLLPRFSCNDSPDSHWIHRVTDNLRAAFLLSKYVRSSSNGAPLHFAVGQWLEGRPEAIDLR